MKPTVPLAIKAQNPAWWGSSPWNPICNTSITQSCQLPRSHFWAIFSTTAEDTSGDVVILTCLLTQSPDDGWEHQCCCVNYLKLHYSSLKRSFKSLEHPGHMSVVVACSKSSSSHCCIESLSKGKSLIRGTFLGWLWLSLAPPPPQLAHTDDSPLFPMPQDSYVSVGVLMWVDILDPYHATGNICNVHIA